MRLINSSGAFELSLSEFESVFPAGWFFSYSVPAIHTDTGIYSVSHVVPMQDEPEPPIFTFLIGDAEGPAYDFVWAQSWNMDEYPVGEFPSPQAAIAAAGAAALTHAANNPGVPQIMKAHNDGGDDGVERYFNEVIELERIFKS
jgi:hypothetical protein